MIHISVGKAVFLSETFWMYRCLLLRVYITKLASRPEVTPWFGTSTAATLAGCWNGLIKRQKSCVGLTTSFDIIREGKNNNKDELVNDVSWMSCQQMSIDKGCNKRAYWEWLRCRFQHYDVINEYTISRLYQDWMGRDDVAEYLFKLVRQIDRNVKLFTNEWGNLGKSLHFAVCVIEWRQDAFVVVFVWDWSFIEWWSRAVLMA